MQSRRIGGNYLLTLTILLFFTAWGWVAAAGEPSPLPEGWTHYSSPEAGFSFACPGSWTLAESRTGEPAAGFLIRGNGLAIYTNFLGGFEQYIEVESRSVSLAGGEEVILSINREEAMLPGDMIEDPNRRLILVSLPDIGPSGLLVYSYDVTVEPNAPDTIETLLSTFTILDSSPGAGDIPASWRTYTSSDSSLTFRYPPDWEIISDFVYETAGGAAADVPSIELGKIGNENSNDWIRINPRQFQTEYGTCLEAGKHTVCTYSSDPAVVSIMELIVSSFSIAD
ncbi:MAG: hypothetical protein JW885_01075 [Deltaproteobacteria bacterium]|nr:hypothetical protein [Candidatus Zymogenaceae bacterium]